MCIGHAHGVGPHDCIIILLIQIKHCGRKLAQGEKSKKIAAELFKVNRRQSDSILLNQKFSLDL